MGFQFFPGVKFHPLLLKKVISSQFFHWWRLGPTYMAKCPTKGRASMKHRSTDGSDAPAEVERITMEDHMLKQEVGSWCFKSWPFWDGEDVKWPFFKGWIATSNVWGWKGHELNHLGVDISFLQRLWTWELTCLFWGKIEWLNVFLELFVEVMLNELVLVLGDSKSSFFPYTEIHTVMKTGNILENEHFEPNNGGGWNLIFRFNFYWFPSP